jgi:hypothetical protein
VSAFSPFTLASTIPNNPLPVELLTLKATPKEASVTVSWITVSEKNTDSFELERSRDGQNFTVIGRLKAQGESSSARSYQYEDQQPAPINYYRLRTLDQNGQSSLSSVVMARLEAKPAAVELYPNPSDGRTLYLKSPYRGVVRVQITSVVGVVFYQQSLSLLDEPVLLPVSLPPGSYLVSVRCGQLLSQAKLIVKP